MKSDDTTNLLQLDLLDGYYYEDVQTQKLEDKQKMPFAKSSFKKYTINIDLAKLNNAGSDNAEIINAHNMLTMSELNIMLDSMEKSFKKDVISYSENLDSKSNPFSDQPVNNQLNKIKTVVNKTQDNNLLDLFSADRKPIIKDIAMSQVNNAIFTLDGYSFDLQTKRNFINDYWISFYDKIIVAYACLLMFFIGAPLGAIIRKGGLGLPIVFAILIFITFNFANTFGKKLAGQDGIHPFLGVAAGSLILTPLAIFLTKRATNDQNVTINLDWLFEPIKNLFVKSSLDNLKANYAIASLDAMSINTDDVDYKDLLQKETNVLIEIVKNALQFGYPELYRKKALKILETRGITQDELLLENNLIDLEYIEIYYQTQEYKRTSKVALLLFILTFIFAVLVKVKIFFGLLAGILLIMTYLFIYKSTEHASEIERINNKNTFINKVLTLVGGFPFYIFFYLYNQSKIKEILAEYKK